jgi:hypothetical protein
MQNNNRDCRPITNARGVGGGTCIYNSICTRGVGDGRGNNLCYGPQPPQPKVNKIDTFTSTERGVGVGGGMNVTFIVNIVLVILVLMVLYKVYNPSTSYF